MSTTKLARSTVQAPQRSPTAVEARVISETPFGGAIETWAQNNEQLFSELPRVVAFGMHVTPVMVEGVGDFRVLHSLMRFLKSAADESLVMHITVPTVAHPLFAEPFSATIEDALRFKARHWQSRPAPRHDPLTPTPSRAYGTFRELMEMLSANQADAAAAVGLTRGAVDTWRRGREPQPRNARRLYRTHTMLKALRRRLGGLAELQHWLDGGSPSARELLLAGDLDAVDRMAAEQIFSGPAATYERVAAYIEQPVEASDVEASIEKSAAGPRRIARRAPRRRTT